MCDKKYRLYNYVLIICVLVFIGLGVYNLFIKDFHKGFIRLAIGLVFSAIYIENRRKNNKNIEE